MTAAYPSPRNPSRTSRSPPASWAHKRKPVRIVLDPDDRPIAKGNLCGQARGFNLHAATKVAVPRDLVAQTCAAAGCCGPAGLSDAQKTASNRLLWSWSHFSACSILPRTAFSCADMAPIPNTPPDTPASRIARLMIVPRRLSRSVCASFEQRSWA